MDYKKADERARNYRYSNREICLNCVFAVIGVSMLVFIGAAVGGAF